MESTERRRWLPPDWLPSEEAIRLEALEGDEDRRMELLKEELASMVCTVLDCPEPRHARGYCTLHYQRWQHHGHPIPALYWAKRE